MSTLAEESSSCAESSSFFCDSCVFRSDSATSNTPLTTSEIESIATSRTSLTKSEAEDISEAEGIQQLHHELQEVKNYLIGAMKEDEAEKKVTAGHFRLYYRIPAPREMFFTAAAKLFIVYASSDGKKLHFPVVVEKVDQAKKTFRVDCEGRLAKELTFGSLPALIRSCRIHSFFWPATGKVEAFPIYDVN
ncbi:hypothetical protein L596_016633 [Steinernema carpocapsae]|uniref:Uncharacterized protein n=1 Tax=Steinernema carpocapsae TaxID=34508 RepID=A0A4U5NJA7_STECR|nr:hypothetical protein L596_016633 [Steinernema carpocapsae]